MANRRVFVALPLITILLATIGCSPSLTATPVPSTVSASQLAPPPTGACGNRLYPVLVGATWTYALSGFATDDTLVRSITAAPRNGFTSQDVFLSGTSNTGEWSCARGALTSLTIPFLSGQTNMEYRIVDQSGVTLPATVSAGDDWIQEMAFEGGGVIDGKQVGASGNALSSCNAGPAEQVTVPAGVFDAIPVVCTTDTNITFTSDEAEFPMYRSSISTSWYVQDVGLVKLDSELSDIGRGTLELLSFSFP